MSKNNQIENLDGDEAQTAQAKIHTEQGKTRTRQAATQTEQDKTRTEQAETRTQQDKTVRNCLDQTPRAQIVDDEINGKNEKEIAI
jgi:hypothetical protein